MKTKSLRTQGLALAVSIALGMLPSAAGAATKTYQVTGPVLEVTDTMIAVQKGKDRWEIARDAGDQDHRRPEGRGEGHDRVPHDGVDRRGQGREGLEEVTAETADFA